MKVFFSSLWYVLSAILKSFFLFFVPKTWRAKDISGEIVLITGAGSGIGRLLAIDFAQRGAEVIACDVNKSNNLETCRLIETQGFGTVHGYYCDVSDRKSVQETAKKIKQEVGVVSILVNNAGILYGSEFLDLPEEKIEQTFAVNALGPIWMCKSFLPDMIAANHGHIVNVASMGGHFGTWKLSDYCATKHAVVGFDECLKIELHIGGHSGVRTTVVCPDFFHSGLFSGVEDNAANKVMSPNFVAKQIVKGVLANDQVIFIPGAAKIALMLKHIFPIDAMIRFFEVTGNIRKLKSLKGCMANNGVANCNQAKVE